MRILILPAAIAATAFCQQTDLTLQFTKLQTPPQFAESATVIRSIGEIRQLNVDATARTITLHADRAQAALADWLFGKLDRMREGKPPADPSELVYRPAPDIDDIVRVFYFQDLAALPEIHERATIIRALTEIRRAFISNVAGAFVVRGTQVQIEVAGWLFVALTRASFPDAPKQHRIADAAGEDTIRLLPVPKFGSEEELQSFATELRMATQMRRVFTYYPLRLIAVRSTPAQVEHAAKLVSQL
jgi:hypothetical protein